LKVMGSCIRLLADLSSFPVIAGDNWTEVNSVKLKNSYIMTIINNPGPGSQAGQVLGQKPLLRPGVHAEEPSVTLDQINRRLKAEIEEHKKTEKILREYQNAVENTNDLIIILDSNYVVRLVNDAFLRHFNLDRKWVVGNKGEAVFGGDLFESSIRQYIDSCIVDKPTPPHDDIILRQQDADNRHMQVSCNPIRNERGEVSRVVFVMKDITDIVRSKMAFKTFKVISDRVGYGAVIIDLEGNLIYVNESFARMHGYKVDQLISKNISIVYTDEQWRIFQKLKKRLIATEKSFTEEIWHKKKNGVVFPIMLTSTLIKDENGDPLYISSSSIDITQRKRDEEALQYSAEFERLITSISTWLINLTPHEIDDGIEKSLKDIAEFAGVDRSYVFQFYDDGKRITNTHEWCREGVESQIGNMQDIIIDAELPWFAERIRNSEVIHIPRVSSLPREADLELSFFRRLKVKSAIIVPMNARGSLVGFLGFESIRSRKTWTDNDITLFKIIGEIFVNTFDRKEAEERTSLSLQEKEVLLKEIHHRVKNNLQIISSLLNLQANYLTEKPYREMFRESQNRVKSMALIHEKLYQSKDFVSIDFCDYIKDLATNLFRSYKVDPQSINLEINVTDVHLEIDKAIPIGLIVNELITNSLKHAFPGRKEGRIVVNFRSGDNGRYVLQVGDDGIGIPDDFNFKETTSLGLQLVSTLADQIKGNIRLLGRPGTKFEIVFSRQKNR